LDEVELGVGIMNYSKVSLNINYFGFRKLLLYKRE